MRIGIDISSVIYETGVSTYTRNLVRNLLKVDKDNEYILFGGSLRRKKEIKSFLDNLDGKFKPKLYSFPPTLADIVWNRLHIFHIENLVGKIDIFHSSDWAQPPSNAHKITTVHDMVPIKYPKLSHPKVVSVHRRRFRHIRNEVDLVIVPSKTTKKDLIEAGINSKKIKVVPEAPDLIYKPAKKQAVAGIKRKYLINGKYLLAVGVTPRKNIERIISAFEKVKVGKKLKLVVVGEPKMKVVQRRGVIFTGHVPNDEINVFYSGAEALVYPSLYEGFGLPILEAFACKVPVVTSKLGSMREAAGNAAVLVDPYSVDDIGKGINKVLENKEKWITMGSKRIDNFSWEKTAEETVSIYNSFK